MMIMSSENRVTEVERYFFHEKSHTYWPRIETRPLQRETGFWLPFFILSSTLWRYSPPRGYAPEPKIKKMVVQWAPKVKNGQELRAQTQKQDGGKIFWCEWQQAFLQFKLHI